MEFIEREAGHPSIPTTEATFSFLADGRVPDELPKLQLRVDELPKGWQEYSAPDFLA